MIFLIFCRCLFRLMTSMNSKERVWAAMNHREPDRVPVMCQLALGHYFLNCGYRPSDIWFDSETLRTPWLICSKDMNSMVFW